MSQFPSFASSTIFVDVALVSSDTNVCIALVDISNSSLVCFPEPVELNSLSFALPTGYQLIALALSDVYNTVCYAAISLTNRFEVRCWNFLSPYAPFPIFSQDLAIQVNFSGSKVFIEVDDYLQRYCYAVAALDVSTGNSTVLFGCNSFSGFIVPVATVTQLSTVVSGFIRRMHLAMTEDGAPTLAVSVDPSGLSQSFGYAVPHGTATPTCVQGTVIDVDVFGEQVCFLISQSVTLTLECIQLQNFNVSIIPLTPLPLANEFHLLIAGDGNMFESSFCFLRCFTASLVHAMMLWAPPVACVPSASTSISPLCSPLISRFHSCRSINRFFLRPLHLRVRERFAPTVTQDIGLIFCPDIAHGRRVARRVCFADLLLVQCNHHGIDHSDVQWHRNVNNFEFLSDWEPVCSVPELSNASIAARRLFLRHLYSSWHNMRWRERLLIHRLYSHVKFAQLPLLPKMSVLISFPQPPRLVSRSASIATSRSLMARCSASPPWLPSLAVSPLTRPRSLSGIRSSLEAAWH